jgi:hypothetical protein
LSVARSAGGAYPLSPHPPLPPERKRRETKMSKYRVQVMVGVDVEAHSDGEAISEAIQKVRGIVGDDPTEPLPKEAWVTGIALADPTHEGSSVAGLMVFRQSE